MATKKRSNTYRADRRLAFIREYLKDHNGAAAARRAGYSHRTARVTAANLLKEPEVSALIVEAEKQLVAEAKIDAAAALHHTGLIATSRISQLYDENGALKPIHDWPPEIEACVASVESFEEYEGTGEDRKLVGYVRKVKLWDKNNALDRLFKNMGLFPPKQVEHGDPGSFKDQSLEERKTAARDLLKRAVKSGLVTILPTGGGRNRK